MQMETSARRKLRAELAHQLSRDARTKRKFELLAGTFQALGDTTRVQIVWALSRGELNVSELASLMDMSQPAVSHHLRTLRNLGLVKVRREGRASFYALDDEHIDRLLKEGILHVEELLS